MDLFDYVMSATVHTDEFIEMRFLTWKMSDSTYLKRNMREALGF